MLFRSASTMFKDGAHSVEAFGIASQDAEKGRRRWVPRDPKIERESTAGGGEAVKTQETTGRKIEGAPWTTPTVDRVELDASHLFENLRELNFIPTDSRERHDAIIEHHKANDRRHSVDWIGYNTTDIDLFKGEESGCTLWYSDSGASSLKDLVDAVCDDPKESLKKLAVRDRAEIGRAHV